MLKCMIRINVSLVFYQRVDNSTLVGFEKILSRSKVWSFCTNMAYLWPKR